MALAKFGPTLADWPYIAVAGNVAVLLNAAGDKYAGIFFAPKTGNILKTHFLAGTVTTGATWKPCLGPFRLTGPGRFVLLYRAQDGAGNVEPPREIVFTILEETGKGP